MELAAHSGAPGVARATAQATAGALLGHTPLLHPCFSEAAQADSKAPPLTPTNARGCAAFPPPFADLMVHLSDALPPRVRGCSGLPCAPQSKYKIIVNFISTFRTRQPHVLSSGGRRKRNVATSKHLFLDSLGS